MSFAMVFIKRQTNSTTTEKKHGNLLHREVHLWNKVEYVAYRANCDVLLSFSRLREWYEDELNWANNTCIWIVMRYTYVIVVSDILFQFSVTMTILRFY